MNLPSYIKVAKVEGILQGATVTWDWTWDGQQPPPNVLPSGQYCLVTNESVEGKPFALTNPGTLTLTPTVTCGDESVELDPIVLNVEISFVSSGGDCPPCGDDGESFRIFIMTASGGPYYLRTWETDVFNADGSYYYGDPVVLVARKLNGEFIRASDVSVTGIRQSGISWLYNIGTYTYTDVWDGDNHHDSIQAFIQVIPENIWTQDSGTIEIDVTVNVDGTLVNGMATIRLNSWE